MDKGNTKPDENKNHQLEVSNVQLSFGMNKEDKNQQDQQFQQGSTGGFNNYDILESVPIVIQGNQVSATWDQNSWEQISENGKNDHENMIPQEQAKKIISILESVPIDQEQFKKELDLDEITARRNRIARNEARKKEQDQQMMNQQFNPDLIPLQTEKNSKKKERMLKEQIQIEIIRCVQLKEMENPITNQNEFCNQTTNKINPITNQNEIQNQTIKKFSSNSVPDIVYESEGKDKILIGRATTNDIIISDRLKSISAKHSCLNWKETSNQWSLSDEGSTNGTFVQVDQSSIKQGDVFIIGLYLCTVVEIKKSLIIQVQLSFVNAAERDDPVSITAKIQVGQKFFIGKRHQVNLQDDLFMEDDHCYLYFEGQRIKIQNCEGVFYKAAKKVFPEKPVDLIDGAIIRFGLVNQYFFLPYLKRVELVIPPASQVQDILQNNSQKAKKCSACGEYNSSLYYLVPCNHQNICTKCASNEACPLCGVAIIDFM